MHLSTPSRRAATIWSAKPRRKKERERGHRTLAAQKAAVFLALVQHQVVAFAHMHLAPAQAIDLAPAPGHLDRQRMHHLVILRQPRLAADDGVLLAPSGQEIRRNAALAGVSGRGGRSGSSVRIMRRGAVSSQGGDACHRCFSNTPGRGDRRFQEIRNP
jgi:hypothetical protein